MIVAKLDLYYSLNTGLSGCESFPLTSSVGNNDIRANVRSYSTVIHNINSISDDQRVQLRLVQSDHRGGFCDCWAVSDLTLRHEDSTVHETPLKYISSNHNSYQNNHYNIIIATVDLVP